MAGAWWWAVALTVALCGARPIENEDDLKARPVHRVLLLVRVSGSAQRSW